MTNMDWELTDGLHMCVGLEAIAPAFGYHVALTGGVLYKVGPRKDLDVLFYRIRDNKNPDRAGLIAELKRRGFEIRKEYGWVQKVAWLGRDMDLFFPDYTGESDNDY